MIDHFECSHLNKAIIGQYSYFKRADAEKKALKFRRYIRNEIGLMKHLLFKSNPESFHKLRTHLKSFNTIISFLQKTSRNKKFKKALISGEHAAMLIGNWHDQVVLIKSIQKFLSRKENLGSKSGSSALKIADEMEKENRAYYQTMKNEIKHVFNPLITL